MRAFTRRSSGGSSAAGSAGRVAGRGDRGPCSRLVASRARRWPKASRSYEPGLLAAAHRGLLYVDEVNLLHDHLVDVLLDAAAMGRATVERDGVSITHPARFVLVGTMNPEEGELRPQLLDRFGLTVDVVASRDPAVRVEVMRAGLTYEADPAAFISRYDGAQRELAERIVKAESCSRRSSSPTPRCARSPRSAPRSTSTGCAPTSSPPVLRSRTPPGRAGPSSRWRTSAPRRSSPCRIASAATRSTRRAWTTSNSNRRSRTARRPTPTPTTIPTAAQRRRLRRRPGRRQGRRPRHATPSRRRRRRSGEPARQPSRRPKRIDRRRPGGASRIPGQPGENADPVPPRQARWPPAPSRTRLVCSASKPPEPVSPVGGRERSPRSVAWSVTRPRVGRESGRPHLLATIRSRGPSPAHPRSHRAGPRRPRLRRTARRPRRSRGQPRPVLRRRLGLDGHEEADGRGEDRDRLAAARRVPAPRHGRPRHVRRRRSNRRPPADRQRRDRRTPA